MRLFLPFLLLVTLLAAGPAVAQELSEDEVAEFQTLMAEGVEAYSAGDFERSIELMRQAQEIYDHPDLMYNLGRAYTQLGRCEEARRAFITYLQRPEITEEDDTKARENLDELSSCVTPAQLAVRCTPAEARVTIDDEEHACPVQLEVQPGRHTIAVHAPGYVPHRTTRTAEQGESLVVDVELQRSATDEPAEPVTPEPRGAWRPVAGWSAIGVGAAAIVTGVVLDASSVRRSGRLRDAAQEGDEAAVRSLEQRARTIRGATIGLYIGGLVAAATGGVLVIWGSTSEEESTAGATVTLRF